MWCNFQVHLVEHCLHVHIIAVFSVSIATRPSGLRSIMKPTHQKTVSFTASYLTSQGLLSFLQTSYGIKLWKRLHGSVSTDSKLNDLGSIFNLSVSSLGKFAQFAPKKIISYAPVVDCIVARRSRLHKFWWFLKRDFKHGRNLTFPNTVFIWAWPFGRMDETSRLHLALVSASIHFPQC